MVSDIFLYLVEAMTISTQTYQNFYFSGSIPIKKSAPGEKKCMNYYPFGLKHKEYNNVTSASGNSVAQKFKYNGVEFEEGLGLGFYVYLMISKRLSIFLCKNWPSSNFSEKNRITYR